MNLQNHTKNTMLKIFILTFFYLICSENIFSQAVHTGKPESVEGRALYTLSYLKDTTQPENRYIETLELIYNRNAALFTSYTARQQDTLVKNQMANAFKTAPDPNRVDIVINVPDEATKDVFYTQLLRDTVVYSLQTLAGVPFAIKSLYPVINWQIEDSVKNINGYLCQKATGKSYGRNYIAWFCTDIPYSFGPRRLGGLPGLILEAYDDKKEVIYTLLQLDKNYNTATPISLPEDALTATQQEYDKAKEAYLKDPGLFMKMNKSNSKPSANNMFGDFDPSKIKSIVVRKGESAGGKSFKSNNPIDLTTN